MKSRTLSPHAADLPPRIRPVGVLRSPFAVSAVAIVAGVFSSSPHAGPNDARRLAQAVCATCHDADGNSANPTYPRLAGQQASYIAKQLREFVRGNRSHEQMSPVASQLKPDDIAEIAAYFSAKTPSPGKPGDPVATERGRALYREGNADAGLPACDGCHGPDAGGSPRFPRLSGQHPSYIFKQLSDIKHGRRRSSPLMQAVAERMTEDEMHAASIYLGGL